MGLNKVIGTRGQGVVVWCPRELTTEHLVEASLWLDWPLSGSLGLKPISSLGKVEIWLKFHETCDINCGIYGKFTEVKLTKNAQVLAENHNILSVAGFCGSPLASKFSVH